MNLLSFLKQVRIGLWALQNMLLKIFAQNYQMAFHLVSSAYFDPISEWAASQLYK